MKYEAIFEGNLKNVSAFYGNLMEFFWESISDGLSAMEGSDTLYTACKDEVERLEEELSGYLEAKPERIAMAKTFTRYMATWRELDEMKIKRTYFLGHRDSGRIQALLWPREILIED